MKRVPGAISMFPTLAGTFDHRKQEIPHPMVKSTARFGAPKIELWPF